MPNGTKNTHPTVKPIVLMQYLIKLITPPNGTILDPFIGSGTTGIAAKLLGFDCVGIDNDPEHLETAYWRIEAAAKER
jgi:site-specific DNA-methyltransferase (adenine-specific)